mgnify:CR=1 FL=1
MAGLMYEIGEEYPEVEIEVLPGVTAAMGGAAVLGAPLGHDCCLISLSDLLTPWEKIETRLLAAAQADFLIAYYHSVLMQHYGPIILVKELPDMNTPYDKMAARSPYDECVDWVSEQFRIVSEKLPTERMGSSYGLATSVAAKALRARLLLYAASPLFNGNSEYYSDFAKQ